MITRSQLCLECALNLADSSWQEEILLTKSSSQNESSSLACDGSPVCVSLAPFLDEVPVNHTNRIVALDIPVFDAIVLESKIEEETECIISIECHHASGTEEQQEELVPPPHILLIHRPTETPQNSNFLIKKPDTPEDNFRKDRNKEERVETSCDNNVVRESQIKYKEEASFMLAVQSFESTVSTVRQIDVWRRKFGSVSLLTHDSLDLSSSCAVYHAPEVESVRVAEDAMTCIGDGGKTVFEEFRLLFPFDVTKPSCFI
jgi:hypothetical protein